MPSAQEGTLVDAGQLTTCIVSQTGDIKHSTVVAFSSANVPRDASAPPEITIPATASLLELQVEVHPSPLGDADWNA